jgi:hypothetical protein
MFFVLSNIFIYLFIYLMGMDISEHIAFRCSVTGVNYIDITCGQLKRINERMETIFKQWHRTSETILLLQYPVAANLIGVAYSCCL